MPGHSDSVFGGTKILTPTGPRCGLKRAAFNQAWPSLGRVADWKTVQLRWVGF
jgi:hypothetical protein